MAEPLSAEERTAMRARDVPMPGCGCLGSRGQFYERVDIDRYEATCRALEAERDRLRVALDETIHGTHDDHDVGPCRYCEALTAAERLLAPDPPAGT